MMVLHSTCILPDDGKSTSNFIERDLKRLHDIISNTTVNGLALNIQQMNEHIADKLEEALKHIGHQTKDVQSTTNATEEKPEKCFKCKRNCKTRAVECINDHWVHYRCEKLTENEIEIIKNQGIHGTYTCTQCREVATKDQVSTMTASGVLALNASTVPKQLVQEDTPTLAQQMLLDENHENCAACDEPLTINKTTCTHCCLQFHTSCINNSEEICNACVGKECQTNLQNESTTEVNKINNTHMVDVGSCTISDSTHQGVITATPSTRTIRTENRKNSSPIQQCINTPTPLTTTPNQDQTESLQNKMRELRQMEIRLKKKEEQLKIKEAMLNDAKEKSKILERLHKAENRNFELESNNNQNIE